MIRGLEHLQRRADYMSGYYFNGELLPDGCGIAVAIEQVIGFQ